MRAQVLGISVDSVPCLQAWADSLGDITYPLLSDFYPHGEIIQRYGILRNEGYSERAIFVIDKHGIVRYVDVHDIEEQPDNDELFRVLAELEPGALEALAAIPTAPVPARQADVVLYCTPWCPSCRQARAYLKERGIQYVEVDISRDRDAAQQVRKWANGNETTPTFEIRGTIVVEFNRAKLDEVFARE
jgi:glutaredoxin